MMLEAALNYARQGLRVHPCRPEDKRPITRWSTSATTDIIQVNKFWAMWPGALIAVCTGDGLVVVDVDPRNGGEQDHEACVETLTATTRSGGWHHYYRTGLKLGNAVGLLPGVDLRGEGGYVIAPPSPGWDWLNDAPIQPLPDAFAKAMRQRSSSNGVGFEPPAAGSVGEGLRHDYMVRFAGWAIRVLEIEDADELAATCVEEYRRACSPADAPAQNIVRIAHSIWRQDQRS